MQAAQKVQILEGTLNVVPLVDLMQVLSMGRQFTAIELRGENGEIIGLVELKSGMILDARTADGRGKDAFFALLNEQRAASFNVFRLLAERPTLHPLGRVDRLVLESMSAAAAAKPRPTAEARLRPVPDPPGPTPHTGRTMAAQASDLPAAEAPLATPAPAPTLVTPAAAPATPSRRSVPPVARSTRSDRRVVAVASPKGGVGKTTLVLNLGVALAERGTPVLLVDGDPQGGLAHSLTERLWQAPGVYEILKGEKSLEECMVRTRLESLRIVPAGRWPVHELGASELTTPEAWERLLEVARQRAALVLVDTPAGLQAPTANVLRACDDVLGVVPAEVLGVRSFHTLIGLLEALATDGRPQLAGVVVNMFQYDQKVSHVALHEALRKLPPDLVLQPVVPRDAAVLEASAATVPVRFLAGDSPPAIAQVFDSLAAELSMRLRVERSPQREAIPFLS